METIIIETLKIIAKSASERIFKSKDRKFKIDYSELESIFNRYLNSVYRWSEILQFIGMESPKDIDTDSIELNFHSIPRRFRGKNDTYTMLLSEKDIFKNRDPYIILGDPGAGKTTTIKRLIRILIREEPTDQNDTYRTPIVIRLREINEKKFKNIYHSMASIIGFPILELDEDTSKNNETPKIIFRGGADIKQTMIDILENSNSLLFFDGLDEVSDSIRNQIFSQIENLSLILQNTKIIATCRSGEYYRNLNGFRVLEITPLSEKQILDIATYWIDNPNAFIKSLKGLPYFDITDRPLLLTNLLFLYKRSGSLPEQPSLVYKRIIRLLLEEWDEQRGIKRISKYSQFDSERKLDFLSSLSFHLTYRIRTKTFSLGLLENCYKNICSAFNLPQDEAEQVAREIETHNGIIIRTGDGYEFSHLSIQEFLAANHIVKSPYSIVLKDYITLFPSPVAIAISISSEPSKWFAGIILNDEIFSCLNENNIGSFLDRLSYELPSFSIDSELGYAIIKLFNLFWSQQNESSNAIIIKLSEFRNVKESILKALHNCLIILKGTESDYLEIKPVWDRTKFPYFKPNEQLKLPKEIFLSLINKNSHLLRIVTE